MSKIIVIVGATATGKTKASISLARELNAEIINADSTALYKEASIATAKVTEEEISTGGYKIITTLDGEIKGAHIVSLEASSLISQIQIAMKGKLKVEDIKEIIFAHPTLSEGIKEALFE